MHNIEYFHYPENVNRDWVKRELDHFVAVADWQEGCSGLYKGIRWLDNAPICANEDAAEAFIGSKDQGWYDNLAVRYYEHDRGFTNKKVEELKEKERAALDAYHEKDSVWVSGLKAEYVGCRNCGSKMKRQFIKTNRCPICSKDLRPDSLLKAVEAAQTRWKKAQAAKNNYICDHAKKTVKWLVKIEYHT